ncbi:MAG: class I adenylate-forming enzyme family protein [Chthoniobacterales bacterium]
MFSDKNNPFLQTWRNLLKKNTAQTAIPSTQGQPLRSFQEIENNSNSLAEKWKKQGLQEQLFSLQVPNSPQFPEIILAAWKIRSGLILLPADMPSQEVEAIEKRSSAAARITIDLRSDKLELHKIPPSLQPHTLPLPAVIKVTSGSTAQPRLVHMSAQQLFADAQNIIQGMEITATDIQYGLIPWSHSYGFSNLISPLFIQGSTLVCTSDAMPQAIRNGILQSSASVFPGVPAHFRALAKLNSPLPDSLRLCISAGAPLDAATANTFYKNTGLFLHSFYGSSECGGICYDPDGRSALGLDAFVGPPLPGVDLRPVSGQNTTEGIKIEVRGPAVAGDVFRPDDLLEKLPNGYRILGRDSDFINIGGKKISPLQIEKYLLNCAEVAEALVVGGIPKNSDREQIAALLVSKNANSSPEKNPELQRQILSELTPHLPAWSLPREILFLPALPVNSRGKINRKQIFQSYFYDM